MRHKNDDRNTNARRELIRRAKQRKERSGRRGLRKTPPRPRRPEQEIREYRAILRDVRRAMEREIRDRIFPEVDGILEEAGTREDSERREDGWSDTIRDLFVSTRLALSETENKAKEKMSVIGDRVGSRATSEQVKQIRAVLGVEPDFYNEEKVREQLNDWKERNGAFITRFADEEIEAAQDAVSRAIRSGRSSKEVQKELRKRFGISDRRAERIARTECGQLNAQITRERQRELGVEKYRWRTSADERVRDAHEAINGQIFSWNEGPALTNGQHPGEPINCRCVAITMVDDLLEELESE